MAESDDISRASAPPAGDEPPPTAAELAAAERLRRGLEGEVDDPDAALAEALRLAVAPLALDPARQRVLVERALEHARPARGRVIRVLFGSTLTLAAAAAGVAVALGAFGDRAKSDGATAASRAATPLVASRSTEALFVEKFDAVGGTSARVDRIASAREADFRANRFASWGAR